MRVDRLVSLVVHSVSSVSHERNASQARFTRILSAETPAPVATDMSS